MKMLGVLFVALLLASSIACADILLDGFDTGLDPSRWNTVAYTSAALTPWGIGSPDSDGRLRIAKLSDSDQNTIGLEAGIVSQFTLVGNFTVSVDFHLTAFNSAPPSGWNECELRVLSTNYVDYYAVLRMNSGAAELSNGALGNTVNSLSGVTSGTFRIERTGSTLTSWLDYGENSLFIGSNTSSEWLSPMSVYICDAQYNNGPSQRPHDAIDVRFDNFAATADRIVPEPAALSLLALGGLASLRRKRK